MINRIGFRRCSSYWCVTLRINAIQSLRYQLVLLLFRQLFWYNWHDLNADWAMGCTSKSTWKLTVDLKDRIQGSTRENRHGLEDNRTVEEEGGTVSGVWLPLQIAGGWFATNYSSCRKNKYRYFSNIVRPSACLTAHATTQSARHRWTTSPISTRGQWDALRRWTLQESGQPVCTG